MGVEIERKFLVDHDKWNVYPKPAGTHFRQGYILKEEARTFRIRVTDKTAYITLKGKSEGLSRREYEYEIPIADGEELLTSFCPVVVSKVRYCITVMGKVWEVDVFEVDNQGLIVAEIELDDEDEKFTLPDWVTNEVTGDDRYINANLSVHPYKSWK